MQISGETIGTVKTLFVLFKAIYKNCCLFDDQVVPDSHFMFGCGGSFFSRCQDSSDIIDIASFDVVPQMQVEEGTGE